MLTRNCSGIFMIFSRFSFLTGRSRSFLTTIIFADIYPCIPLKHKPHTSYLNTIISYEKYTSLSSRPSAQTKNHGLTMVMDKGLSIREAEDFMSVGSEYTDFVKLGFGTSLITPGFEQKIKVYKNAGCIPYFGGTLFEAFVIRNMFEQVC